LPFNVRNNSFLFAMRNAELHCIVDRVTFNNGSGVASLTLATRKITIEPEAEGAFRCLLGQGGLIDFGSAGLMAGHIFLAVEYQMLGMSRMSPQTEFTWFTDAKPPRWVRGKIAR